MERNGTMLHRRSQRLGRLDQTLNPQEHARHTEGMTIKFQPHLEAGTGVRLLAMFVPHLVIAIVTLGMIRRDWWLEPKRAFSKVWYQWAWTVTGRPVHPRLSNHQPFIKSTRVMPSSGLSWQFDSINSGSDKNKEEMHSTLVSMPC